MINKEELYNLYFVQKLAIKKIAELYLCDVRIIARYIKKFKIKSHAEVKADEIYKKIIEIVTNKGGKTLFKREDYINNTTKFYIECKNDHTWSTFYGNLQKGKWCPKCSGRAKITIEEAQNLAKPWNGELLSTTITKNNEKLIWKCAEGHIFKKSYDSVKSHNIWCNECKIQWKSEEICRIYFETIFGEKFIKCRPDWLRNRFGKKIELDGFCEKFKLAFEHNGSQHYNTKNEKFNKTADQLLRIQSNDDDKLKICKNNGVKLIIIPQLYSKITTSELETLVKNLAIEYNITIKNKYDYDFSHLSKNKKLQSKLKEIQDFAISKGGKCLSEYYFSAKLPMVFECKNAHKWTTTADKILNCKTWCFKCHAIKLSEQKGLSQYQKDLIYTLYVIDHKNINAIAKLIGRTKQIISKFLTNSGVPIRKQKSFDEDKNVLYKLYIIDKLSTAKIAKIYNSDSKTVYNKLKKFNIPIRYKNEKK